MCVVVSHDKRNLVKDCQIFVPFTANFLLCMSLVTQKGTTFHYGHHKIAEQPFSKNDGQRFEVQEISIQAEKACVNKKMICTSCACCKSWISKKWHT